MKYFSLVFSVILFASCGKVLSDSEQSFVIKQGKHYCDQTGFRYVSGNKIAFEAKFDSSCIYQSVISTNQDDINKLWGFNEGLLSIDNSARIGWNWKDGQLLLHPYTHYEGQHYTIDTANVAIGLNKYVQCSIEVKDSSYLFVIDGKEYIMKRKSSSKTFSGFQLYPYFGGDETAPHSITIYLKK